MILFLKFIVFTLSIILNEITGFATMKKVGLLVDDPSSQVISNFAYIPKEDRIVVTYIGSKDQDCQLRVQNTSGILVKNAIINDMYSVDHLDVKENTVFISGHGRAVEHLLKSYATGSLSVTGRIIGPPESMMAVDKRNAIVYSMYPDLNRIRFYWSNFTESSPNAVPINSFLSLDWQGETLDSYTLAKFLSTTYKNRTYLFQAFLYRSNGVGLCKMSINTTLLNVDRGSFCNFLPESNIGRPIINMLQCSDNCDLVYMVTTTENQFNLIGLDIVTLRKNFSVDQLGYRVISSGVHPTRSFVFVVASFDGTPPELHDTLALFVYNQNGTLLLNQTFNETGIPWDFDSQDVVAFQFYQFRRDLMFANDGFAYFIDFESNLFKFEFQLIIDQLFPLHQLPQPTTTVNSQYVITTTPLIVIPRPSLSPISPNSPTSSADFFSSALFVVFNVGISVLYVIIAGASVLLLLCCFLFFCIRRYRKGKQLKNGQQYGSKTDRDEMNVVDNASLISTAMSGNSYNSMPTAMNAATGTVGTSTVTSGLTTIGMTQTGDALNVPGYKLMNIKQDVRVDKKLAEGGFGAVFQGTLLNHQMTFMVGFSSVAVKTCKNEDSMDPMDKAECNAAFQQELAIMEHYQKNPNIVKLVGFSQAPNVMVMKYYELGDLMGYLLGKTKRVPSVNYGPSVAASLLYDLANAMEALHEDGIAHCDVKPGNILLELQEGKLTAILCDFGICQVVSNKLMKVKQMKKSQIMGASLLFSPPEVLKDVGSVDPFMADVYSFGIVAYCCASRTAPYHDADPSAIQQLILDGNQPKLSEEVAKEYSTVLSLMSKCCNLNPKSRVTMKQVKSILSS